MVSDGKVSGPEASGLEALQLFGEEGLYSAETVLTVLARRQGIRSDLVPAIATGFAAASPALGACAAPSAAT